MLAWSLTYLVHSTLLIGAVWLISRRLADRPLALDRLWKLALVGGVVTATVQTAAGLSPAAVQLGASHEAAAVAAYKPVEVRWHFDFPTAPLKEHRTRGTGDGGQGTGDDSAVVGSLTSPAGSSSAPESVSGSESASESVSGPESASGSVSRSGSESVSGSAAGAAAADMGAEAWKWVVLLAVVISLLLAMRLGVTWFRLRRILSDRQLVTDGQAALILEQLEARAGLRRRVRLSATSRLEVPIAIGIVRPEICVPRRALEELDTGELETMLAHELAHLVRRDPAWRLLAGLVCRVFFFQPLNRLAAARIETASELLCDDWAVEHTDEPLALARCLTEVAGWIAAPALEGSPVPAMARGGSGLGRRVRRLLAAGDRGSGGMRRERWFIPLGAGLVALLIFAAPGATDTAPRPARPVAAVPPVPPVPAAAPVMPVPAHHPVKGDLLRLLTQLRSGQRQDQDVGDWIALAQALGSPGNTHSLAQIFQNGLDLDLDVDVDLNVNPDGSIDIHVRPNGAAPPQDPDPDADADPNFFDFDFDFDQDITNDSDDDDDDDADDDDDDEDDDADDDDDDDGDDDDDHDDDGDCQSTHIDVPDVHIDREAIREMTRQAQEMARQARQQAHEAARQARDQARQAREQAHEAARQAHQQASQIRQQVQQQMEEARRQLEQAQREQHRALRDAWRQMRQQKKFHYRFAVPPPVPPVPPVPPTAPRAPRAPHPPTPPAPPADPFDDDSN